MFKQRMRQQPNSLHPYVFKMVDINTGNVVELHMKVTEEGLDGMELARSIFRKGGPYQLLDLHQCQGG